MLQIILPLLLQSGLHIPYTDNATSPSPLPSKAWQSDFFVNWDLQSVICGKNKSGFLVCFKKLDVPLTDFL